MINKYRAVEYFLECDICGIAQTIYTNDKGGRLKGKSVHSEYDAVMAANYHVTKEGHLCDECFKKYKRR